MTSNPGLFTLCIEMKSLRLFIGVLFLGAFAFGAWKAFELLQFASVPWVKGSKQSIILDIHKGGSRQKIADELKAQGVIGNVQDFIWLGRITHRWAKLKAGEYEFSPSMTPLQIFDILDSGISVAFPFTIPEGNNMYQVAETLEEKGFGSHETYLQLFRDASFIATLQMGEPKTLEGYLYPETYSFPHRTQPIEIVRKMVHTFKAHWAPEFNQSAKVLGLTPYQVVTLASVIEKETGAPEERPLISSIFHNRLRKHMRLESDPTTIYGIWDRYAGKIHKSDLLQMTPYNTYKVSGLPAGPICNPGLDAITAALHPAQTDYFYFVSHNDGTHQFSKTYKEHAAAVRKFQLDPRAREGKSWRDLSLKKVPTKTHESQQ